MIFFFLTCNKNFVVKKSQESMGISNTIFFCFSLHFPVCSTRVKALPHVTISSTMDFNVAEIASARASSTKSLTISLRVAGP